jgi:hypothetical protein
MYARIIPDPIPKVGDRHTVPTGPAEAVEGMVTAVDPEGVMILKLPSGLLLVGYYAESTMPEGVHRITRDGQAAKAPDRVWVFQTVERR